MNSHQAKQILSVYRPGTEDDQDPDIRAALAFARQNQELGEWLERHCETQAALRAQFRRIPVPEGLKEQIISERKAHARLPSRPKLVLAAVCLLLFLFLGGLFISRFRSAEENSYANFSSRMLRLVTRQYPPMDLETSDLTQIRQYLQAHQAPGDYVLPQRLEKTASTGCAIRQWQGKTVAMVCFNSGQKPNSNQPDLFLFVARREDVPDAPQRSSAQLIQTNSVILAKWSTGANTYLLAGQGEPGFVRQYVP